jgi:hypothetical protein
MIYDFTKNFSWKLKPKTSWKEELVSQRATEATQRFTETGIECFFSVPLCASSVPLCVSS